MTGRRPADVRSPDVLSPDLLLESAAHRFAAFRPDLAARADLTSPAGLVRARELLTAHEDPDPVAAVCVINRFSLPDWLRETCAFALTVDDERRDAWRRTFTRTLHLAGSPANLAGRFRFDHAAADGSTAWLGPAPASELTGLRLLLRGFEGSRPPAAACGASVTVPGGGHTARRPVHRELYLATAGVTLQAAVVQLHHLVAEAVLDGLIGPGDRLTLRPVPRLSGLRERFAALRVDTDVHRPDELQAFAGLTEEC
ncbi:DUF6182 family protein [Streptomyces sp. NPDC048717]|uniref:DUF6182 family protein n=1 Tax=Streptomyces sp. NPDC048717 TaxID=3154928 RepID=UPI00342E30F3